MILAMKRLSPSGSFCMNSPAPLSGTMPGSSSATTQPWSSRGVTSNPPTSGRTMIPTILSDHHRNREDSAWRSLFRARRISNNS